MRHHLGRFGGCFSSVCGVGTGGSKGPRAGPDCAVEDAIAYDVNGGVAESGTDGDGTGRTWQMQCMRCRSRGNQREKVLCGNQCEVKDMILKQP